MADEVQVRCMLGVNNLMSDGESKKLYALIEVMPTQAVANAKMPLSLALVLDHSGSMAQDHKLDNLKSAVKIMLGELQPQDRLSLVVFDDESEVAITSRPLGDARQFIDAVDALEEGGGTEMSRGMQDGLAQLQPHVSPDLVSRMIVLTDGQTFGDDEQCVQLAGDLRALDVPVTALGLGDDWNKELLTDIADKSKDVGGMAACLKSPADIAAAFSRSVKFMQASVVRNAYLTLRLVRGVVPRRVWRVTPLISDLGFQGLSDRDAQVALGDLEVGVGQSILVEIVTEARPAGQVRLAQAEVIYDAPAAGVQGSRVRTDVVAEFVSDPSVANVRNELVMDWVAKATVHQLKTQALKDEAAGDLSAAANKMRQAATVLLTTGDDAGAAALASQTKRLDDGEQTSQDFKEDTTMGGATARLTGRL